MNNTTKFSNIFFNSGSIEKFVLGQEASEGQRMLMRINGWFSSGEKPALEQKRSGKPPSERPRTFQ